MQWLLSNVRLKEISLSQNLTSTHKNMRESNINMYVVSVAHQRGCTSSYVSYLWNLSSIRIL